MITFEVLKQSRKSRARIGVIRTPHGEVETPALVSVATQAAVKALTWEQVRQAGSRLLIANTFHLHQKPGETVVRAMGGLHRFSAWSGPFMSDSGGFQVFSLGFGKDFGVGKLLKQRHPDQIGQGQQPRLIKITDQGVHFTSFVDGTRLFLGPKESIRIQESLGADIILAFDECTPPIADHAYTRASLARTHQWAELSLKTRKSDQAMYGVVQGGKFKDLRTDSAKFIGSLPFDGFGIGGEFGDNKKAMSTMLRWVVENLPAQKPRHLLGIGYLEDLSVIIKEGVDTFDCIVPTHYARHGIAFTRTGKLDMHKRMFLKDKRPLDAKCPCIACANHSRSYVSHLMRAKEIGALTLLSLHNLSFFNAAVAGIREKIRRGSF